MKKTLIITLLIVMAVSFAACGKEPDAKNDPETDQTQIPNPFVACDTMEDAEKVAGFAFNAPESFEGYSEKRISAVDSYMVQVVYTNGGEDELCLRKAVGSDDISGDYNSYDVNDSVAVEGQEVTIKGNGDTFNLATWVSGDYAYSIRSSQAIDKDALCDMVKSVLE